MVFRDDHAAALARIDVLEREVAKERAERTRLQALQALLPRPPRKSIDWRRVAREGAVWLGVALFVLVASMIPWWPGDDR